MFSLLVLTVLLALAWAWGVAERDRRASFVQPWLHVPLIGAAMCLVMAIGLALR